MEPNVQIGSDAKTLNANILTALRALEMSERNYDAMIEQKKEFSQDEKELTITELNQIHKVYKSLKSKLETNI